jgi:hypothetical protein
MTWLKKEADMNSFMNNVINAFYEEHKSEREVLASEIGEEWMENYADEVLSQIVIALRKKGLKIKNDY